MYCTNCGQKNTEGKYCNNCGINLVQSQEKISLAENPIISDSKSSYAWVVVLLLMLLIASGAYLLLSSENLNGSPGTTSVSSEAQNTPGSEPAPQVAPTTLTYDANKVVGGCYFRDDLDPEHSLYCEASVLVINESNQPLPLGDYGGFEMFPAEYASGSIACDGAPCPKFLEPQASLTVTVRNGTIYQRNAQISGFWLADSTDSSQTLFVSWDFSIIF